MMMTSQSRRVAPCCRPTCATLSCGIPWLEPWHLVSCWHTWARQTGVIAALHFSDTLFSLPCLRECVRLHTEHCQRGKGNTVVPSNPTLDAFLLCVICHPLRRSGKTHAALEALAAAPSGLYCGPLRLLACEVGGVDRYVTARCLCGAGLNRKSASPAVMPAAV